MVLHIETIESKQTWEDFMTTYQPQTFLHSWAWGDFNGLMGSKIFRLGVFEAGGHVENGKQPVAMALILKIEARRGTFLFCPHGPIFKQKLEEGQQREALETLLRFLRELAAQERCDFIRISPLLYANAEHEGLFKKLGFGQSPIHMHSELAWILDLSLSQDELLKNMRKTTRYCIKKAEKDGVKIVVSTDPNDVEIFWKVYQATVDRQNFTPFSKNYLRKEFEMFAQNGAVPHTSARFFFAYYNDEVVAAAMIIFYQGSAFYHHGASIHKYPKITAPYLLQWAVIQEAKQQGCRSYDFWGIAPEDKPKHPWAGLSLFKKGFGGHSVPYVHAKDFVVSKPKYWISWLIETVRRLRRGL